MHSPTTTTIYSAIATGPASVGAVLLIGTRGSALARRQAETVVRLLSRLYPASAIRTENVRTEGDADKESPLTLIGGRGVFTSALQDALLAGRIDAAVHSAKDLPSLEPPGIEIAAFPEREDPRDVVVSRHGVGLEELPANPTIGTSSRRRAVQVRALRPDAQIIELRGNIDTRLRKAIDGELDAIILAAAGVVRMGWLDRVAAFLPVDRFTPAPGQGALAVETRRDPDPSAVMVRAINDAGPASAVRMERAFLRGVGGGCTTPIGAHAAPELGVDGHDPMIRFHAMLASDDGARLERLSELVANDRSEEVAFDLAIRLVRAVRPRFQVAGIPAEAPLTGLTVLVTRAPERAQGLVTALEVVGALPVVLPAIVIERVEDQAALATATRRLVTGDFDWIVFTSANAVGPIADQLRSISGLPLASRVKVAAVGEATVAKLRDVGMDADLVPDDASAAGLVDGMRQRGIDGDRILCPQGNLARPTLVDGLRAAGATVDTVMAYRTVPASEADPVVRRMAHEGRFDVVTFASPSAVDGFLATIGADLPALSGACFVCIGSTTAAAVRARGLPVHAVAEEPTDGGLVEAIIRYFGERPARSQTSEAGNE